MTEFDNLALLRFQNPEILWALFIIPVIFALYFFNNLRKKKILKKFGDIELIEKLTPDASKLRPLIKFIIYSLSMALLIIAMARPQSGAEIETDSGQGKQIVIALDVSNSMLADDIKPDRLTKAKMIITDILRKNEKDRTALVIFAGEAYIQIPLSSNFNNIDLFMSAINPDAVPVQGTNFKEAIELSSKVFDQTTDEGKILILLSDGENHEEEAINQAKKAYNNGIIITTIGMGKNKAIPLTEKNGEYKKDKDGNIVLTKLNETLLKQIAAAAGGEYFNSAGIKADIKEIQKQLDKLDTSDEKIEMKKYKDLFYIFIIAAFVMLIIDFSLLERKNKWLEKIKIFD